MYDDVDNQMRELDRTLDDFRETLRQINNFNAENRRQRIYRCDQLAQHCKTLRAGAVLEIKAMEDEEAKEKYKQMLREKVAVFRDLSDQLEMKRHEIDRDLLVAESAAAEEAQDMTQTQQVIAAGDKIQDQSQEAVTRMKQMLVDTEKVGLETAAKMDEQIVQMGGVAESLNDIEYNVKRARATARSLATGAASDRCIQGLCVGILLCVVVLIILSATA